MKEGGREGVKEGEMEKEDEMEARGRNRGGVSELHVLLSYHGLFLSSHGIMSRLRSMDPLCPDCIK